jgi:hypothetical protein
MRRDVDPVLVEVGPPAIRRHGLLFVAEPAPPSLTPVP